MIKRLNLSSLALILLLPFMAAAAETPANVFDARNPIQVEAEHLEADSAGNQVRFSGGVVARQDTLMIYADELLLRYSADNGRELERVEATGSVRIVQGDRVATAGKGVFLTAEGKIVLTGSPRVNEGGNSISGDEITVFLNEERSVVSSEPGSRVNAVFQPGEGEL